MSWQLFIMQALNGVQLGLLLFLLSAGLTLILGIMRFLNLAHGSLYMMGAYIAAAVFGRTDSFLASIVVAIPATLLLGFVIERFILHKLYERDHLYQVLATFGLILFFNELVRIIWGSSSLYMGLPESLSGIVTIAGLPYPSYRFAVICMGLLIALGLYLLIHRTRLGMLIRAGASNAPMVGMLGVNIKLINSLVFAFGAGLAGLAGLMSAPIMSVQSGMGEPILILTLVVIVTGGIGSIRGAFYGAIIVGFVDTVGRAFLPLLLSQFFETTVAQALGPTIASILIYLFMAVVLAIRPEGLFKVTHG
ncbi:MAG TPA: branched-chain amino acid ABC transporter permease [Pusillimonas sp.]|jgi:branched-chain amino acid transport system permease protein|nr:branched-chain amino acid ABC transporter permease [Pusillimonas sp.]MBC43224.1 branched-chain amino acid ABC transporter permease [Pusillimonas sp.]HBT33453.1 branched-chain amino acid ABC transporter permease [Pusillimonas sp.]|tara:strand:+ start:26263 stop:27183 length:921 start_codon:yes stop_codon:yes gene_type:complete